MTINRVRIIVLAFSLFIILACAAGPAWAQNPGPPTGAGTTIQSPAIDGRPVRGYSNKGSASDNHDPRAVFLGSPAKTVIGLAHFGT